MNKGLVNPGKTYQRPLSSTSKSQVHHKIVTAEHNHESNVTNIVMRNKPRTSTSNQPEVPKQKSTDSRDSSNNINRRGT